MTQALAQRGVRGALGGMATGRVGKLAGRGRALETGWEIWGGTGVAMGM
jgi:hypothetical protein